MEDERLRGGCAGPSLSLVGREGGENKRLWNIVDMVEDVEQSVSDGGWKR